MKYTKKAFLTMTQPGTGPSAQSGTGMPAPSGGWGVWSGGMDYDKPPPIFPGGLIGRGGSGGGGGGDQTGGALSPSALALRGGQLGGGSSEMNQLLQTMAIRQSEQKTPYTNQLLRLKNEVGQVMGAPNLDVTSKLSILKEQLGSYRNFMRKSRARNEPTVNAKKAAVTVSAPAAPPISASLKRPASTPFIPPATPSTSTGTRSVKQKELLSLYKQQEDEDRAAASKASSAKSRGMIKQSRRLIRKLTPDSGLGASPPLTRRETQTWGKSKKGKTGRGRRRPKWSFLRFKRTM